MGMTLIRPSNKKIASHFLFFFFFSAADVHRTTATRRQRRQGENESPVRRHADRRRGRPGQSRPILQGRIQSVHLHVSRQIIIIFLKFIIIADEIECISYFVPVQRALLFDAPHICCYVNNGFVIQCSIRVYNRIDMCCPASTSAGRNIPRVRLAYLSPPQYHTTILYFLLHSYYRHDFSHDSSPAEKSAGCFDAICNDRAPSPSSSHHHSIAYLLLAGYVCAPFLVCTCNWTGRLLFILHIAHTVPDSLLMHQTPYTLVFVSRVQLYSPILYISYKITTRESNRSTCYT